MNLLQLLADKKGLHKISIETGLKESFNKRHENTEFKKVAKRAINCLRALNALKDIDVQATSGFTFKEVGVNLVSDNVDMANEIIDLHDDSDYYGLQTFSVAAEREFVSKTYEVQFSIVPNYLTFIEKLVQSIKDNGCKKYPVVTFNDFSNKAMPNGQKIGKYLARCGVDNGFIGNLDQLLQFDNGNKYLTISGATQHIIGMSYFLDGESSCQNWKDNGDVGYALHSFAGSQCREQYVMFLHDGLDCLHYGLGEEFMLSRTTVLRQEIDGVEVFFHGKTYGSDSHLHKQIIKQFDGHFNSYEEYHHGERTTIHFKLAGGNTVDCSTKDVYSLRIESSHGMYFSVTCPMCDGDGETRHDIYDEHGDRVGRTDIECRLCGGSGDYDLEVDEDIDGEAAADYVDEDVLQDMVGGKDVFKFYDGHAFEGFVNHSYSIGVYADKMDLKNFVRTVLVKRGESFLLAAEREGIINELVPYSKLLQVDGIDGFKELDAITLLDKFVFIYGFNKLGQNSTLQDFYLSAKGFNL